MVSSEISYSSGTPSRFSQNALMGDRAGSTTPFSTTSTTSTEVNYAELTDEELVALCKQEIPTITQGYEELVRRYESLIYGFCRRSIGTDDDAEEVCQDAFLRVFHKIHQFEGRSSFKTWLFRIVVNMCSSRKAALAKRRIRSEVVTEELTSRVHSGSVTPNLDDLSDNLRLAMDRLDEKNREIIIMKYVSGLQLDEIAAVLKLKLSATKMRLYRARDELKTVYLQTTNTQLAA